MAIYNPKQRKIKKYIKSMILKEITKKYHFPTIYNKLFKPSKK